MGDPSKTFQVQLAMFMKFRPKAIIAISDSTKLGERTKMLLFGAPDTMQDGDSAQIDLLITALERTRTEVEEDVTAIDVLVGELAAFTKANPAFVDDYDEIKHVNDDLAEARRKAVKRPVSVIASILDAKKARAKAEKGAIEALDAWAEIDNWVQGIEEGMKETAGTLSRLLFEAESAVAARDKTGLKNARDEADKDQNKSGQMWTQALKARMDDFTKRFAGVALPKQTAANLAREKVDTQKTISRLVDKAKANEGVRQRIMALKIEPVDARKAASSLGGNIAKFIPRLEKVLALEPAIVGKALDALLKEAGHPMSGKDAVAKLKKDKIL